MEEADKVEVRFWGSVGDRGRKSAILVRTVDLTRRERGAVELLVKLSRTTGTKGYLRASR